MSNGRVTLVRLLAATIITLACLASSVYLIVSGHSIPVEFAIIEVAGMTGVVGIDVIASVIGRVKQ